MGCVRSGEKAQKNENFASKSEKELWRKVQNTDQILEKCGERYCYVCYEGQTGLFLIPGNNQLGKVPTQGTVSPRVTS